MLIALHRREFGSGVSIIMAVREGIGVRSAKNDGEGQEKREEDITHTGSLACR